MKDTVIIKSYQNGITLHLNADADFSVILEEIRYKFSEAKSFFGKSKMALSVKGRVLEETEEMQLIEAIHESCDVMIMCIVGNEEEVDQTYLKALNDAKEEENVSEDAGQFYKGTLKNNQVLETESSIVILGDVQPGSAVISAKNIIVLGSLLGEAYAGVNGNKDHFVAALDLSPQVLKIGDYKWKPSTKHKWGKKPKAQPQMAYIKGKEIVTEALTKDILEFL